MAAASSPPPPRLGRTRAAILVAAAVLASAALPPAPRAEPQPAAGGGETVDQALCRVIGQAAGRSGLPVAFLTRLIWQESSFRPNVVSPAGAQGIAQFMPGTAFERGLADPFDPEQAIPASAAFLGDLVRQFGNVGLAAAAYNGGPARVTAWLAGKGGLPFETQDYVQRITGRSADDWAAAKGKPEAAPEPAGPSCLELAATLRTSVPQGLQVAVLAPFAPWGVQLAGNFSKAVALRSFAREQKRYASILGDLRPMVIGTRFRSRGFRAFYRVRVPAETRVAAAALCARIHAAQGSCIVLRS